MTDYKAEWIKLMRPLVDGHATLKMVSKFDQLTSRMFAASEIDFDDLIAAQLVIRTAREAAQSFKLAGIEGRFLPQEVVT